MLNVLLNDWWVIGIVLLPIIFLVLRNWAKQHAKLVALKWIAVAEKMIFVEGDSRINFVSQKAYNLLPAKVKLFIPAAAFTILVRGLYDEVKLLIQDMHQKIASQNQPKK